MSAKQLSLHHLMQFPTSTQHQETEPHYPAILAIHGRGSNERDLIGLASHLPENLLWISPRAPFLLGFSQGSLLSMCYALTHPARVAGVIAQSGYIPTHINLEINETAIKNKPFILTHGEQDTMLPIEWARASRDWLQKLGVNLTYHEFQMGHNVSLDSLEVISTWLEQQV